MNAPTTQRMTPQRAAILRLLEGNKSHPSAEEIYRRVKRKFPGLSFATVYNNLQALLSSGDLTEVRIDRTRTRFDPCTRPHAHLMCIKCGRIADISSGTPALSGRPAGFRLLYCNVEFYGVCPACAKKADKKKSKEKPKCPKKTKKR